MYLWSKIYPVFQQKRAQPTCENCSQTSYSSCAQKTQTSVKTSCSPTQTVQNTSNCKTQTNATGSRFKVKKRPDWTNILEDPCPRHEVVKKSKADEEEPTFNWNSVEQFFRSVSGWYKDSHDATEERTRAVLANPVPVVSTAGLLPRLPPYPSEINPFENSAVTQMPGSAHSGSTSSSLADSPSTSANEEDPGMCSPVSLADSDDLDSWTGSWADHESLGSSEEENESNSEKYRLLLQDFYGIGNIEDQAIRKKSHKHKKLTAFCSAQPKVSKINSPLGISIRKDTDGYAFFCKNGSQKLSG